MSSNEAARLSNQKLTKSEELFASYFDFDDGEYTVRRIPEGTQKEPDFGVRRNGVDALFEVKEFDGDAPGEGFGTFDLYGPIRQKLQKGAEKFKRYKGQPCCVVLYNCSPRLVLLNWQVVAGAMLGNLGMSLPIGVPDASPTPRFLEGGKMVYRGNPINTTISAVLVVRKAAFAGRQMVVKQKQLECKSYERLDIEHSAILLETYRSAEPTSMLVVENPYAASPLPRDWFCGSWDERYGADNSGYGLLFAGPSLQALEEQEQTWLKTLYLVRSNEAVPSVIAPSTDAPVYRIVGLPGLRKGWILRSKDARWHIVLLDDRSAICRPDESFESESAALAAVQGRVWRA